MCDDDWAKIGRDYLDTVEVIDGVVAEVFGPGAVTGHTNPPFTFANMLIARLAQKDLLVSRHVCEEHE